MTRQYNEVNCSTEPPESGELYFEFRLEPVSLQANRSKKDSFTQAIRQAITACKFFLSGEVAIDIEWFIHERLRYETNTAPDVDNILKVLLDALCGPSGIIINDCQVQSVSCHWIDSTDDEQEVRIRIQFSPDVWLLKEGLRFVRFGKVLCLPINERLSSDAQLKIIELTEKRLSTRDELEQLTGDYYTANLVMPTHRPFHASRVQGFQKVNSTDLKSELTKKVKHDGN